jgi:Uncharacterised nucleotidyltransferase
VNELGLEGSFWPSERQKLLLRTAFCDGEAGAEAWRRLRPRLDLDRLELGSFPLLPLVHRQLERLGIEDSYLPRLAGIRRRTWYLNRLELEQVAPALRALEEHGVEPVVVGGWELVANYHGDMGLRPVDGLDVLVRPGQADAARRALAEAGYDRPRRAAGGLALLAGAHGRTCTVHRRLAREFSVPERGVEPEDLREETIEISLGEARARALGPTDELVRLCLEGARAGVLPNVLWAADALAVVRAEPAAIDWERLVGHARRLRAVLRLRDALVYLRRELDAPVPDDAIRELEATPARSRERLAHGEAGRRRRLVGPSPRTATRFLQVTSDTFLPAALVTLPTFLRDELSLERRAQVPLEVVRRTAALARRDGARETHPVRQSTVEAE